MPPLRVLFFTGHFRIGGAEQYLVRLLERFDRRRIEPSVACLDPSGPLREELDRLEVPVQVFPMEGSLMRRSSLRSFFAAGRWIRQERFDVVQTWTSYANVVGGLAGERCGRPTVVALRGSYDGQRVFRDPNPGLERLHHWIARRAARVLVNSQGLRKFARDVARIPESRLEVIPNGVDERRFAPDEKSRAETRRFLDVEPDTAIVLYVGRLAREKGIIDAARAFARTDVSNSKLVFVGEGRDEEALRAAASEAGVVDRLFLLGARSDVERWMNAADAFLFASHREGCPNAILEAMATGIPVVATDACGIRELVTNDLDGVLAPVGDIDAIAAKLRSVLSNRSLAARLGKAARQRVQSFRFDDSVAAYERVYEEIARGGNRPAW